MVWRLRATEPGASSAGGGRFAVASHLDLQQVFAQDHRAAEPRLGGLNPHLFGDLQIIVPRLPNGRLDLGLWDGNGHTRGAPDVERRARSFPTPSHRPRPHGRSLAVLVVASRLHGAARRPCGPSKPAQGERVLQQELCDYHERHRGSVVLRFCVDKIGIDNVMWAIDYPYQPTAPAVAFLESAPLSTADRERIAHGNAERIFGIRA